MAGGSRKNADDGLVAALAAGASAAAAAEKAGVSERTVRRRLEDPAFRARVDEARADLVRLAVGRLADVGALAGDTLAELVKAGPPAVRLGAARSILEFMLRGAEVDTLARQVSDLKRQVEDLSRGNRSVEAAGRGAEAAGGRPGSPAAPGQGLLGPAGGVPVRGPQGPAVGDPG
jgi:hypothetical protein